MNRRRNRWRAASAATAMAQSLAPPLPKVNPKLLSPDRVDKWDLFVRDHFQTFRETPDRPSCDPPVTGRHLLASTISKETRVTHTNTDYIFETIQ